MSKIQHDRATFPPVRACIFGLDGLLINSEDIYTEIYNNILHSNGKPDLPWSIKAKQQSRGRGGMLQFLDWVQLPVTYDEWTAKISAQYDLFQNCALLPGVHNLLSSLSTRTAPAIHLAIGSSATSKSFKIKTSHLPIIASAIPQQCIVLGDDPEMSDARKKPMPDVFLLALGRINANLGIGEREVKPEECLVFEDSTAGIEAGRRAGMRVIWVPHRGLREVYKGRERMVLEGKSEEVDGEKDGNIGLGEKYKDEQQEESRLRSEDGWAEMLMSLEDFDYEHYGIQLKHNSI